MLREKDSRQQKRPGVLGVSAKGTQLRPTHASPAARSQPDVVRQIYRFRHNRHESARELDPFEAVDRKTHPSSTSLITIPNSSLTRSLPLPWLHSENNRYEAATSVSAEMMTPPTALINVHRTIAWSSYAYGSASGVVVSYAGE